MPHTSDLIPDLLFERPEDSVNRSLALAAISSILAACASSSGSATSASPAVTPSGNPAEFTLEGPLKFTPRPTSDDISAIDLMSRLYIFADDSMMGRDDGGPLGATKASAYIERELRRLRLRP